MMKKTALLLVILWILVLAWFWDSAEPAITLESPPEMGNDGRVELRVEDRGKGLSSFEVTVTQSGRQVPLADEHWPAVQLPWQAATQTHSIVLAIKDWQDKANLEEGAFEISVKATDQANLWVFSREAIKTFRLTLDVTAPAISPISIQHYLRQGGSEAALYRVSESNCRSGVRVGKSLYSGYPIPNSAGAKAFLCLFALPYDELPSASVVLWAQDSVGNRSETPLACKTFPQKFRKRRLNVSDSFISRVTPEILARSPEVSEKSSLLETYLEINSHLRKLNNEKIAEVSRDSQGEALWDEPFLQLSNSKVESVFADQRSYYYQGRKVDEQVHLGFDLASLAHSSVEVSNSGRVVFADFLGIYGNCVIVDHGLGLSSLYGHLSSIDVAVGDHVVRGQSLGRTGQTGLAGGDHLHFSMLVQGTQVNPIEWWDPKWVKLHIQSKMELPSSRP